MQKWLCLILAASLLTLSACNGGDTSSAPESIAESSSEASEDVVPESVTSALALIEEGKYAEAYAVLYADRDNEDAKAMLEDFKVYHTRTDQKSYDYYCLTRDMTYNEHGDVLSKKYDHHNDQYDYETHFSYTYDDNGNMLSKSSWYASDEDDVNVENYKYDENGNLIETKMANRTITYSYDDRGNMIKSVDESEDYTEINEFTFDDNGNVITEISKYENDEESGLYYSKTNTYDEQGNLLKTERTDDNGDVITYDRTYNEHGDEVKYVETRYYNNTNEEGRTYTITSTYEYKYDDKGRITEKVNISDKWEGYKVTETFEYDDKDNVTFTTSISDSGSTTTEENKYTYFDNGEIKTHSSVTNVWGDSYMVETYDDKGNVTYQESVGSWGTTKRTHTYVYDEKGHITEKVSEDTESDGESKASPKYTYAYDENGRIIKETATNKYGLTDTVEYEYNEEGLVVKKTDTGSLGVTVREYDYDEHGNQIAYTYTNAEGEKDESTYKLTYDEKGNITKKETFENGELEYYIEYTYHEVFGKQTSAITYTPDGVKHGTIYSEYDDEGNLLKTEQIGDGPVRRQLKAYVYDEVGNVISEHSVYNEYVYDYTYSEFVYFYLPENI